MQAELVYCHHSHVDFDFTHSLSIYTPRRHSQHIYYTLGSWFHSQSTTDFYSLAGIFLFFPIYLVVGCAQVCLLLVFLPFLVTIVSNNDHFDCVCIRCVCAVFYYYIFRSPDVICNLRSSLFFTILRFFTWIDSSRCAVHTQSFLFPRSFHERTQTKSNEKNANFSFAFLFCDSFVELFDL